MQYGEITHSMAVVHLVWVPFGIEVFHSFVRSYQTYPAGCGHDLVILFNGISSKEDTTPYQTHLTDLGIRYSCYHLPAGQDIAAYCWIAGQLKHEYVLFLNSYSQLLAGQWGLHYLNAISGEGVGAVSATGSWQSYYSTVFTRNSFGWDKAKGFSAYIRKYKLLIKTALYWRFLFKPFPNPHLRTNAFIIKRTLFLSIAPRTAPRGKFRSYVFESGIRGLSGELLRRGYELLLVDRLGRVYGKEAWKTSGIFWTGNQENLLVADNQTKLYADATPEEKRKLTYLAWGKYE